jgi:hypothetical protein
MEWHRCHRKSTPSNLLRRAFWRVGSRNFKRNVDKKWILLWLSAFACWAFLRIFYCGFYFAPFRPSNPTSAIQEVNEVVIKTQGKKWHSTPHRKSKISSPSHPNMIKNARVNGARSDIDVVLCNHQNAWTRSGSDVDLFHFCAVCRVPY